ncbi:hypothetical protein [Actinoplanes sp. G11-F43]|uniref:hypothetical protein n=1 Tax=Actinoplanes sp. G11-F43 TaxID=3424130 RepID=UPI003D34DCDA
MRTLVGVLGGGLVALGLGVWFSYELFAGGDRLRETGRCLTAEVSGSSGFRIPRMARFAELSFSVEGRMYAVTAGYEGRRLLVGQPVPICTGRDDPETFTFAGDEWSGDSFGRWLRGEPIGFTLITGGIGLLAGGFQTLVSGGGRPTSYRPRH